MDEADDRDDINDEENRENQDNEDLGPGDDQENENFGEEKEKNQANDEDVSENQEEFEEKLAENEGQYEKKDKETEEIEKEVEELEEPNEEEIEEIEESLKRDKNRSHKNSKKESPPAKKLTQKIEKKNTKQKDPPESSDLSDVDSEVPVKAPSKSPKKTDLVISSKSKKTTSKEINSSLENSFSKRLSSKEPESLPKNRSPKQTYPKDSSKQVLSKKSEEGPKIAAIEKFSSPAFEGSELVSENRIESPETPNLGSPVKETNKSLRSEGSAYWSKNDSESQQLKQKILEYEAIIEKQSEEISLLRRQIESQSNEYPFTKKRAPSNPAGMPPRKFEGSFLRKEPEVYRKDDIDFWKINDEQLSKEPQKLEDIASLKDLWILNMESGATLFKNLSTKKIQGVKPNPLNRNEIIQKKNNVSRVLPKISTNKNMKEKK